jgi:hypothetical protein
MHCTHLKVVYKREGNVMIMGIHRKGEWLKEYK